MLCLNINQYTHKYICMLILYVFKIMRIISTGFETETQVEEQLGRWVGGSAWVEKMSNILESV